MNEEEFLAESAGLGEEAEVEENQPEVEAEQQEEQELDLSPIEQEAFDQGWRPKVDFKGKDGHWKSPIDYIVHGKYIEERKDSNKRIDNIEKSFNERLEAANRFAEAKRVSDIASLKKQQHKAAFEDGDEDAYKEAQDQIDTLEAEAQPVTQPAQQQKAPEIVAWEDKNPWINDPKDERSAIAITIYDTYAKQHKDATFEDALAHVDSKINTLYPTKNPRREQPNVNETPQRKAGRKGRDLGMGDLTADELNQYNSFGRDMFTEKEFLKAVKDQRVK